MNRTLCIYVALLLFAPALAAAQIVSETSAEADSGGNSAGALSGGDVSASARTTTVVGEGQGTVEIEIKTRADGALETEHIQREIPGRGTVRVNVDAASERGLKASSSRTTRANAAVFIETNAGAEEGAPTTTVGASVFGRTWNMFDFLSSKLPNIGIENTPAEAADTAPEKPSERASGEKEAEAMIEPRQGLWEGVKQAIRKLFGLL